MYYRLFKEQEKSLLSQPESGMGYQIIEGIQRGFSHSEIYIVLNAEFAIPVQAGYERTIKNIVRDGSFKASLKTDRVHFTSIKLLAEDTVQEPSGGAIDNPKEQANGTELFVRLSAFEDDKRVDKVNKCLLPGSFTTTEDDYIFCKASKADPVNRYALPNELAVKWAFHIQAARVDILQRGKVQPANGKQGGGKEIYFEAGTSAGTFLKLTVY